MVVEAEAAFVAVVVGVAVVDFTSWIRKFEKPAVILTGAAVLTGILMNIEFNLLEANLFDLRMKLGNQLKPDSSIVLITVDDLTTRSLNEFTPLTLDLHARFMEELEKYQPKAVGYLVDMNRVNQANPELYRSEWGTRFVKAANRLDARGVPVILGTPFDVTGEVVPPYPLSALPHSIAHIHKDGNVFAEDKVTRRALAYLYDQPVFHLELPQRLGLLPPGKLPSGSFHVPEVEGQMFFFRYHGSPIMNPQHPNELPYKRVSFIDVLRGTVTPSSLNGKILLVGTLTKENSGDFAYTPYSKSSFVNPKLVIHANVLDSVIHNHTLIRTPEWINWLTTYAVTAFVVWWVFNSTPLYGLFATLTLTAVFSLAAQLLFSGRGLWIRESQPLIGIFLGYYLFVPYRLIREYSKRWDYQRKHALLIQVEELKTNFLSLVTHDLKTPVARIQGLAEVLLRKSSDRLIDKDKETLSHIIDSTDELNRFITSILELNKVESNRLQLHLESKDINQLIERAVEGFRAQSRARQIKITANLEPLFPIRLDASLISKVINNLIDNALKYSSSASEILIESREAGDWVEISVKDQGIGMSTKEIENLFTRFYRAKNDTTTQVSGTGLGLYLTKFFVEAHEGRVEVTSELEKGSIFKIFLPIHSSSAVENTATKPGLTRILFNKIGGVQRGIRQRFAVKKENSHV